MPLSLLFLFLIEESCNLSIKYSIMTSKIYANYAKNIRWPRCRVVNGKKSKCAIFNLMNSDCICWKCFKNQLKNTDCLMQKENWMRLVMCSFEWLWVSKHLFFHFSSARSKVSCFHSRLYICTTRASFETSKITNKSQSYCVISAQKVAGSRIIIKWTFCFWISSPYEKWSLHTRT